MFRKPEAKENPKEETPKNSDTEEEQEVIIMRGGGIELGTVDRRVTNVVKVASTLTYSDEDITKLVPTRDANNKLIKIDFYAGDTLKFSLDIPRDVNGYWTKIERV